MGQQILNGSFTDLKCEPLPDGTVRYPNHARYVRQIARAAEELVDTFDLLLEDADAIISEEARGRRRLPELVLLSGTVGVVAHGDPPAVG